MNKAFLSHSSVDKGYVEIVARKLRRSKIIFDEQVFAPGQDFRDEIVRGIDASRLFVFFVSKDSLKSVWCRYELDLAQKSLIEKHLVSFLAIIIDNTVSYKDLPSWMQGAKAVIQPRTSQAARDIQIALYSIMSSTSAKPFVGRQVLQDKFNQQIALLYEEPKRILVASGLEGIGKRSYLERAVRETIALNFGPSISITDTSTLVDIFMWCLDETADLGTRAQMAQEQAIFADLPTSEKIAEVVNRMIILCGDNNVPCLVDEGGMLDDSGQYRPEYGELLSLFVRRSDDFYLAITHKRVPVVVETALEPHILHQRIPPLEQHEVRLLLGQLLRRAGIPVEPAAMEEIVDYLDGYAPSAYFAATCAEQYGVSTLVADKALLVDFKSKRFTKYIRDLQLSKLDWDILKYLASEQRLPLPGISFALVVLQGRN
jgi:hypothetical protein